MTAHRNREREQERAIETGREGMRSSGFARRAHATADASASSTPVSLMRRLAQDMDRLLDHFSLGSGFGLSPAFVARVNRDLWNDRALEQFAWAPQVETFRRGDKLVVRADLPGLKKDDVRVEIDNGFLTISGERCDEHEEEHDKLYRSERTYGRFFRSLPLPEGVGDRQCEAKFKDGVLEVTLDAPKRQTTNSKQIPIR